MDTSNERPTQGAHGAVGELAMESGDWRSQTQRQTIMNKILDIFKKHLPFSGYERQQELKKIAERVEEEIYTAATNQSEYSRKICFNMLAIETRLQNPMSGPSIPQTDNLNGGDWQEEVYQKIKAMKRLYVIESSDWRAGLKVESRQRVVNKMINSWRHPSLLHEELQELKKIAERYEEKTYNSATSQAEYLRKISLKVMNMENRLKYAMPSNSAADSDNSSDPGSSSLLSGLPTGSSLQQRHMANVAGQNSNLQNIQNMSNVQQNTVENTMGNNNFANKWQIPGRQQLVPQQQPQSQQQPQAQNSHYHYQQQLQQMAKQKLQPSMQPQIQQTQQPQQLNPGRQQLIPQQLPHKQPQTQNSHYLYQQHLQQMAKQAHIQHLQQMRSHMMHNNIGSNGMQGSSSLSSAMSPSSSLPQPTMQQLMLQQRMLQQQRNVQQNQQRLRPTEGTSGTVADHTMDSGDWRDQVQASSQERIRIKIMDTLKRNLPFSGEQELNKIAERIEEGFYAVATSQSDYLRKLSLKMLTVESRSHNAI